MSFVSHLPSGYCSCNGKNIHSNYRYIYHLWSERLSRDQLKQKFIRPVKELDFRKLTILRKFKSWKYFTKFWKFHCLICFYPSTQVGYLGTGPRGDTSPNNFLDPYRGVYSLNPNVSYCVSNTTATVSFNWNQQGTGNMLMIALPHHVSQQ